MYSLTLKQKLLASAFTLCGLFASPSFAQDISETKTSDDTVVTVVGTRNDAIRAQMKSANTVSVMSSDDLEHTAVHNVAEALALLPGVSVTNTGNSFFGGVDGASRGEGMFVGVRGMNTEFTLALVNGVNVAQGMPYSRQVQLSLLPPSGLKTIIVNKNTMAEMDGDSIGGTVDFRTPTAFNFKDDSYASVTISGRIESRARDYGEDGLGNGITAEYARKFGSNKQFGLYVSAFKDERNYANSMVAGLMNAQNDGGWGYLHSSDSSGTGTNPTQLDAESNLAQTGINLGVSTGTTKRYGGNFSLDWNYDESLSLYLRGSYAFAETQQNSTLVQFVNDKAHVLNSATGLYDLNITASSVRSWYETNPEDADLSTLTLGGEKKLGNWTLTPSIFYSQGNNDRPDHIEASMRNNQSDNYNTGALAGQKTPYSGLFISYDSNGFPVPLLTTAQANQANNANTALLARRAGQLTQQFSGQEKIGLRFDAQYDFASGNLAYIKTGFKRVDSHRSVTSRDWTNDHLANVMGQAGVTWSQVGLATDYFNSIYPGQYNIRAPKVNHERLFDIFFKYFNSTAAMADNCYLNCNTLNGDENVSSAYVTGKYNLGSFEIIPGVRYEHTDIKNTYWSRNVNAFKSNKSSYDEVLPSLFVNYRPAESKAVYRASITRTYMRPAMVQLGNGVSTSGKGSDTLTVTEGNPNLKTLKSWNLDASAEWSNTSGTYAMVGLYRKDLSDYMFDNGSTQVNSNSSTVANVTYDGVVYDSVTYVHPTNGGKGSVAGIELQLNQKFSMLPGWLSGFSAGMNLTRQWTQVDIGGGEIHRIQNSPDFMANLRLNYAYEKLSVDVNYNYSGESVLSYNGVAGLDTWARPTKRTDLHVGYAIGNGLKLDVSVSNLFKDYSYWAHVGQNSLAVSDIVDSGSTTLVNLKYEF